MQMVKASALVKTNTSNHALACCHPVCSCGASVSARVCPHPCSGKSGIRRDRPSWATPLMALSRGRYRRQGTKRQTGQTPDCSVPRSAWLQPALVSRTFALSCREEAGLGDTTLRPHQCLTLKHLQTMRTTWPGTPCGRAPSIACHRPSPTRSRPAGIQGNCCRCDGI